MANEPARVDNRTLQKKQTKKKKLLRCLKLCSMSTLTADRREMIAKLIERLFGYELAGQRRHSELQGFGIHKGHTHARVIRLAQHKKHHEIEVDVASRCVCETMTTKKSIQSASPLLEHRRCDLDLQWLIIIPDCSSKRSTVWRFSSNAAVPKRNLLLT